MGDSLKKTRIEIVLLFILYLFILPRVSMEYDMGFWREWALNIHRIGLANTYNTSINYFPVYVYFLYIYDLLQGTEINIINNINNIKIFFVFFDFLPLIVLCCFRQRIFNFKIPYLYLLLNIAYVFNSMVWGQIDCIYTNLAFLAIIIAVYYPVLGASIYILALNTKLQAIEFLPFIIVILFYSIRQYKTLLLTIVSIVLTQFLIVLPFILNGGIAKLVSIVTHSVGLYNRLSISAFNFWYLVNNNNPYEIVDTDKWFLVSYRVAGLVLFSISAVFIMLPFLIKIWKHRKLNLQPDKHFYETLFLGIGMLCLCFFYFNSEMHERYAHPIIIFFFFYGVVSNNYKLFILASIPYILSLDKCFSYPDGYLPIYHYKFIYASKIIAIWYTLTLVYGSYLYYFLYKKESVGVIIKTGSNII